MRAPTAKSKQSGQAPDPPGDRGEEGLVQWEEVEGGGWQRVLVANDDDENDDDILPRVPSAALSGASDAGGGGGKSWHGYLVRRAPLTSIHLGRR